MQHTLSNNRICIIMLLYNCNVTETLGICYVGEFDINVYTPSIQYSTHYHNSANEPQPHHHNCTSYTRIYIFPNTTHNNHPNFTATFNISSTPIAIRHDTTTHPNHNNHHKTAASIHQLHYGFLTRIFLQLTRHCPCWHCCC